MQKKKIIEFFKNFDPYLVLYAKINSNWTIGLNIKPKTVRLLKKKKLYNIGLSKIFLDTIPKAQAIKNQMTYWILSKLPKAQAIKTPNDILDFIKIKNLHFL